jgi:hypothetical protein
MGEIIKQLDMWDYVTFLSFFVLAIGGIATAIFILGLPGRIAIARKHPDAEAINLMGYLGFLAVVPWMQAFLWAFKPTNVIDIRRFPREEQAALEEQNRQLTDKAAPNQPATGTNEGPAPGTGEHA